MVPPLALTTDPNIWRNPSMVPPYRAPILPIRGYLHILDRLE